MLFNARRCVLTRAVSCAALCFYTCCFTRSAVFLHVLFYAQRCVLSCTLTLSKVKGDIDCYTRTVTQFLPGC